MEIAIVALGTLLTLAVIALTVLLQERALCRRTHRRAVKVASVLVVGRPSLEREAVAEHMPFSRSSLAPGDDLDAAPPTQRSRR